MFNVPDTAVGRRSKINEITIDATEVTDSTEDYGLGQSVPQRDIDNADERYRPLDMATMQVSEQVALAREVRVANLLFSASTYLPGLKQTLAGTAQFSDRVNSKPIDVISQALDQPLMRPNQIVLGQAVWTSLRGHPEIVEAVLGTAGQKGLVSRQAVAELFEVNEVIVGAARSDTAKPGQAPALTRLWGKHIALLYKAPVVAGQGEATFAATFEFGGRRAGTKRIEPGDMGIDGGQRVMVAESVKERVIASQSGYFIENAIA
jgi:hypothetical protein